MLYPTSSPIRNGDSPLPESGLSLSVEMFNTELVDTSGLSTLASLLFSWETTYSKNYSIIYQEDAGYACFM